jgi:hypothetical protein
MLYKWAQFVAEVLWKYVHPMYWGRNGTDKPWHEHKCDPKINHFLFNEPVFTNLDNIRYFHIIIGVFIDPVIPLCDWEVMMIIDLTLCLNIQQQQQQQQQQQPPSHPTPLELLLCCSGAARLAPSHVDNCFRPQSNQSLLQPSPKSSMQTWCPACWNKQARPSPLFIHSSPVILPLRYCQILVHPLSFAPFFCITQLAQVPHHWSSHVLARWRIQCPHQWSLIFAFTFTITFVFAFTPSQALTHTLLLFECRLAGSHMHLRAQRSRTHSLSHSHTNICTVTHSIRPYSPRHIWCSHRALTSSLPPDCKYFSLQVHVVEKSGTWFGPLSLMLGSASVILVVSVFLILFIAAFCLSPFITYCGSCHATGGPLGCGVLVWPTSRYWQYLSSGLSRHVIGRY